MPSARTTIRGSALKSRFGVNGIQNSSRDSGFCAAWLRSLNSAWPMAGIRYQRSGIRGRAIEAYGPAGLSFIICLLAPRAGGYKEPDACRAMGQPSIGVHL